MEFEEVGDDLSFAKIGIFGSQGSGKTRTAAEIAIGLHHVLREGGHPGGNGKIFMLDTEKGRVWVKKLCDQHGIKLMGAGTRNFRDLIDNTNRVADENGILLIDSVTHFWENLKQGFKEKYNKSRIDLYDWEPVKDAWQIFKDMIVTAPLHMLILGRLGYEYEDEIGDNGKKKSVKSGVKMKSEAETGYEPDLLVVMDRHQDLDSAGKVLRTYRTAHVLKDRNPQSGCLDGMTFENPTYASFSPYFSALNLGGVEKSVSMESNSNELFQTQKPISSHKYEGEQCDIIAEEIKELLKKHYPSRSADDQQSRLDKLEAVFETRSFKAVEVMSLAELKVGYNKLHEVLEGVPKYPEMVNGTGLQAADVF